MFTDHIFIDFALPKTIKQNSTFIAKALRRDVNSGVSVKKRMLRPIRGNTKASRDKKER